MSRHTRQAGMSLIELMISLLIGAVLIVGAISAFSQSRANFRVAEKIARLQEDARFAMDLLATDIQHSRFWGLTNRTDLIDRRAGTAGQLGTVAGDCDVRWYITLDRNIEGLNGTNIRFDDCIPLSAYQPGTDILASRHASPLPIGVENGRVLLQTTHARGELFVGDGSGTVPSGFPAAPASQTHALDAHAYFVAPQSLMLGAQTPALRRIRLVAGPAFVDEEIVTGIEDMQILFGVDTDSDFAANRYVHPDDPIIDPASPGFLTDARIVAVRIWLRVRALDAEVGFVDGGAYNYAGIAFIPPNDGFRRLLISRTVQLRNTRGGL